MMASSSVLALQPEALALQLHPSVISIAWCKVLASICWHRNCATRHLELVPRYCYLVDLRKYSVLSREWQAALTAGFKDIYRL